MTELSPRQQELYDLLFAASDKDLSIAEIHAALFGATNNRNARLMQMRVGALAAKVNAKLLGQRIEPGFLKRTYRLNTNYKG